MLHPPFLCEEKNIYLKRNSIIYEYEDCKKIMDMNKKFQLFGNIKLFIKRKNDFIYYFTFKNNSYIFFPIEMKVVKLKLNNDFNIDNLFYLEEYIENKNDIVFSYIKKNIFSRPK